MPFDEYGCELTGLRDERLPPGDAPAFAGVMDQGQHPSLEGSQECPATGVAEPTTGPGGEGEVWRG